MFYKFAIYLYHKQNCSYDGSFTTNQPLSQAGWIIRDTLGMFKGDGQGLNSQPRNATERELQALLFAMMNCWSQGYKKVIFEGDNLTVTNLLNKKVTNVAVSNWLKDIWRWESRFEDVKFCWTNRLSNTCADLAKQAMPRNTTFQFHSYVPMFLNSAMAEDYFDH